MTLECDHRMGMDVLGDPGNVKAFRFACSMAINPIEYWVMKTLFPSTNSSYEGNSGLYSSITIGLGQKILNGEMVDIFISNGYLVIKSMDNRLFLVIDPETGIVRDVMVTNSTFSYSSWCYSDQQTEWASDLGNDLLTEKPEWLSLIGVIGMNAAENAGMFTGSSALTVSWGTLGTAAVYTTGIISIPVSFAVMAYYPYFFLYEFPEKLRILKEMNEMATNQTPLWIGTLSLFLPEDREPTPEELQEAQWKAGQLLMTIAENNDRELYNELIEIGKAYLMGKKVKKGVVGTQIIVINEDGTQSIVPIPSDKLDIMLLKNAILNTCRFIKGQGVKLVNGVKAGDPVAVFLAAGGVTVGTGTLVLLLEVSFNLPELWEQFVEFWEQDTNNTGNSTSGGSGGGGGG